MPSLTADHAVFQRLGHAEDAAEVAGVEIGRPGHRAVSLASADGLGLVLEPGQGGHRPEDLLM